MKINDNNHIHEKQIHIFLFWANQSQHQSLTAKSTPTRYDRSPNSHQLMFDYCLSSNIPRSLSCEPGRPARDVGQAKRTRAFPIFVMGCSCSLPARCIMCAMCWNPMQTSGLLIHWHAVSSGSFDLVASFNLLYNLTPALRLFRAHLWTTILFLPAYMYGMAAFLLL